jgi:L-2-hydroxyglutarate oxidase LhgO
MIYDIGIVGGGIVGLAVARELLLRYPHLKLVVLEKEPALSRHQSGHNSGVIHSGIYYTPGSLKARLCVEGRKAVWEYCERKSIPYKNTGKLIIATEEAELARLDELMRRGGENGLEGLEMLDPAGIEARAPAFRGLRAIWSPQTGIVDWQRVALSYGDDVREAGGAIYTGRQVTGLRRTHGVTRIETPEGALEARSVITCGGLHADRLAQMTGGKSDPKIVPFRGDYLILRPEKAALVTTNIYPVPDPEFPFLGVHFTPRMDGAIWLGPNAVLAFAREGYEFLTINPRDLLESLTYPGFIKVMRQYWKIGVGEMYRDLSRAAYVRALQRYMPDLTADDCLPGPSGVRAQAMEASGAMVDDFFFEHAEGVLHVRNAPSPAATSSLAIGRHISDEVERLFSLGKPLIAS